MKVFVSSVVGDYEEYRRAAEDAIEASGHEAVVIGVTNASSPEPSQAECLAEIEASDVVVLLLGRRYGTCRASGKPPTHEEIEHARRVRKPVLAFVEEVDDREAAQDAFLEEIGGWEDGYTWKYFSTPIGLLTEVVKALTALAAKLATRPPATSEDRLPPPCRERVEFLRTTSPDAAERLVELLSDPRSRQRGVLSRLSDDPTGWLAGAGYAVWEGISDFIDAHALGSSNSTLRRAIEAGSPRSQLYLIRQAETLAEEGNRENAEDLSAQVPADHPLMPAVRALIAGDPSGAVEVITTAGLHRAEDPELARYSVARLIGAYLRLEKPDLATEVLRYANERFPDRAWLLFHQANTTLGMVNPLALGSSQSHDLLSEAAELALRSRDLFRTWDGPSHLAVAAAMQALLAMGDPQRAAELASEPPRGEATEPEAAAPDVQAALADAFLMLGRYREIDTLHLEGIDASEAARIRAMQAGGLGDNLALPRMRRAFAQATDDQSRLRALFGMAFFGEVDETALSEVPEADAALCRSVAALRRGDTSDAMSILTPHRLESAAHVHYLAQAQHAAGQTDDAVATLVDAAQHLGDDSLREPAAEMLFEQRRLDEAALMAADALARTPSRVARNRLRRLLAAISELRLDWEELESYARAVVRDSPDDMQMAWVVVHSLHQQVKNEQAWGYLVAHNLVPFDEETAQLAIVVCNTVDAPEQDAAPVLTIAGMYTDSEQVTARAIAVLMTGGERFRLTDEQRLQLSAMTDDFFERFPDSDVLRSYAGEQPEELLEVMGNWAKARAEVFEPLLDAVNYGQLPYGELRRARELPYAELLLSRAAGFITGISADEERRQKERRAVAAAIETEITADTSVVAVGVTAELDVRRLAAAFQSVLVGDELVIDARLAAVSARQPTSAYAVYDPVVGGTSVNVVDEDQQRAVRDRIRRVLEILEAWQSVRSGPLPLPEGVEEDEFRPWDASIRVALDRQCALWCDDLALRRLAESAGISAFGTWALYESLRATPAGADLPQPLDMKLALLRAGVADVPISLPELTQAVDDSDTRDDIVGAYLSRPLAWSRDLPGTLNWYLSRASVLSADGNHLRVAGLLYAGSLGSGAAAAEENRSGAIGALLAVTIGRVADPSAVPALVAASRYAAGHLDASSGSDPLQDAARHLLNGLESEIGPGPAAQTVVQMFSEVEPADRQVVSSIVLGDR